MVAVLAAYMAGLALGAALAARWASRVRRPVLVYGFLELGIALWALGVPAAIAALRRLYLGWLGGLETLPETLGAATHAFHLFSAFAVLVPCTALMGATLPLLARHAVQRDEEIGPRVGLLYAVNTAGAVAGTTAAGFALLPWLGLRRTLLTGVLVNALVFVLAAALARSMRAAPAGPGAPRARPAAAPWILPAIAVSGAVSFGYEVLWFRLLGQLIGTSTAAFSTMLASFLAGIALGSALAARWARSPAAAGWGFACAQLATASAAWFGFRMSDVLPVSAAWLEPQLGSQAAVGALLGTAVLLPLTLCIGASFPFAVRLLARDAAEASASSARVYAWNTVGSIVGAVGTGYAVLPWIGFEGALLLGLALNLALAGLAASWLVPHRVGRIAVAGALALALAGATTSRPEQLLRRSPLGGSYDGPIAFFAVGRSATVALFEAGAGWRLTTNGLPESLIHPSGYPSSGNTARWLSLLPVLARPDAEEVLIIGLGGGITLDAVPGSVASIDVIELEPEVVAANRALEDREGGNPLADPRVALRLGDARGALILASRRYDAIVSQPSHPWTAGASHLYTREFFELVRERLAPDGVFVQWIGAAFADAGELRSLLAALNEAFEHVELYHPPDGAHLMLASMAPLDVVATAPAALAANAEDFAAAGIHRAEDVAVALSLDAPATRRFARGVPPNTDDLNQFASWRPRTSSGPRAPVHPFAPFDPLPRLALRLDVPALTKRLAELRELPRAQRMATALEPPLSELGLGWISIYNGRPELGAAYLRRALEVRPGWEEAELGLAVADSAAGVEALPPRAQGVVRALRAGGDWQAVRSFDDALARWRPGELLFREAARLRVAWRLQLGETEGLAEAAGDLEQQLRRERRPALQLLHAHAMARLGSTMRAWYDLDAIAAQLPRQPAPQLAAQVRALATELSPPPDPRLRERVLEATAPRDR